MSEFDLREYQVTPRRRLPTRWYLALVGLIMALQGGGVLFGWAPVPSILELLYPNKEPPAFESRDLTWAWVFLLVGLALLVWFAARLAGGRQVIRADGEGVHLPLGGPLGRLTLIPWGQVGEVETREGSDDFGAFPVLRIGVEDARLFPRRPWGARWVDGGVLSVSAEGWAVDPAGVVEHLLEVRMTHAGLSEDEAELRDAAGGIRTDGDPATEAEEGGAVPSGTEHAEGLPP